VPPTRTQLAWRRRIEAVLRIAEPGLNLVLATGDRISRIVEPDAGDVVPPARRLGDARAAAVGTARSERR
jgi:hypothetical protein